MPLIHHVVVGAGSPPIVLVHGLACGHTDWRAQVAHFSPRHMTVAVDLRGHGATPGTVGECNIERYGVDLADLMRVQSLPTAVVVGHSLGCRVVLEAALRAPEHVAGIVLVDGSRFGPGMTRAFEARFAAGEYLALARGLFEQMFTPRSDPATTAAVLERALSLPEDIGQALLLSLVQYDVDKLESVLEETNKPLLVLQATFVNQKRERASMTPGQTTPYLDFIAAKVPSARIEVLSDVGHFPQLDAPGETNRAIERFIARLA